MNVTKELNLRCKCRPGQNLILAKKRLQKSKYGNFDDLAEQHNHVGLSRALIRERMQKNLGILAMKMWFAAERIGRKKATEAMKSKVSKEVVGGEMQQEVGSRKMQQETDSTAGSRNEGGVAGCRRQENGMQIMHVT